MSTISRIYTCTVVAKETAIFTDYLEQIAPTILGFDKNLSGMHRHYIDTIQDFMVPADRGDFNLFFTAHPIFYIHIAIPPCVDLAIYSIVGSGTLYSNIAQEICQIMYV